MKPVPPSFREDLTGAEIAGQQEVGIAVRVDIGECRREGQLSVRIRARDKARANRHELADILKAAAAVVAPQIVRRRFEPVPAAEPVGEEQVEVAVAVVVGRGHRVGVSPVRDAQRARRRRESTGAVVAERLRSLRVDGDEIRMPVAVEIDEVPRQIDVVRFDAAIAGNADKPAPVMAKQPAFLATSMSDVELERSVVVDVDKRETPRLPIAGRRCPPLLHPHRCARDSAARARR